jgi:hypothetical protein
MRRREMLMPLRRLAVLIATAVATFLLAGCAARASPAVVPTGSPAASVSPTPTSPPAGPLLTVETRGGECPEGACGSIIVIETDGRVHATAPAAGELRVLPDVILEGLVTEISKADFSTLKSHPFTGTCPVAFDGQETIYTFVTSSGSERVASCEVEVDPSDPLFVAVSAALRAVGR